MGRLEDLTGLRSDLAEWIDEAPVDRKAALIAQYRAVLVEIEDLTPKEEVGDSIDEIARRRAARRAGSAANQDRSKRTS